ncbi:ArnT family glycosyltransferase [Sedimentisphaera salicampi]|uniref:Dolichyl-phosphate-mannose-protein mannosyltransferase n=1 Tax=Sedimentisphaera salicampi TaxID=1941349 RepID=A0A1W6LKQ0_9BACT|nr:phospholipid carrier-dependent glycosyltransferase [Sedimentisphaera salicampi]ARN56304.1 Dolichyl-phosphate-mannose-protein mannosyltransferase [Sedimentisphaera salicampi]
MHINNNKIFYFTCFFTGLVILYSCFIRVLATFLTPTLKELVTLLPGIFLIFLTYVFYCKETFRNYLFEFCAKWNWVFIFFIALILRIVWVFVADVTQLSDFSSYEDMSIEVFNGGNIFDPTYFRPSGPSILFALSYHLFGQNPLSAQVVLALLGALTVVAVYWIVYLVSGSLASSALASMCLAFWPSHIIYSVLMGTDTLFCFLVVVSFLLLVVAQTAKPSELRFFMFLLSGVFIGLSNWTRGTAPLFLLAWILYTLFYLDKVSYSLKGAFMVFLGFIIVVLPIFIHNYNVFKIVSPSMQRITGWSLMMGVNLDNQGGYNGKLASKIGANINDKNKENNVHDSILKSKLAKEEALKIVKESPFKVLTMILTCKPSKFIAKAESVMGWSLTTSPHSNLLMFLNIINHAVYITLIFWSGVILCTRWFYYKIEKTVPLNAFLWAFLLSFFSHMILEVQPRYHHMFIPLFIIILVVGLNNIAFRCPHDSGNYSH